MTLFSSYIQDLVSFTYTQDYLVDTLNMHSTRTSNLKYGGSSVLGPGADIRFLVRLVEASLAWHKILDIDQDFPLHCKAPHSIRTANYL